MNYYLETYGCEMNKAESAALETMLRERGWRDGPKEDADLVLINTCTVRATAENRAWARISLFAAEKRKRNFAIVVVGCMAEQYRDEMRKRAPEIDYVLGTFQKQSFGLVLDQIAAGTHYNLADESPSYVFSRTHLEPGAFRAFVPIMHGCNNFCSYCIVPYVRGREVSRSPEDILAELDSLEANGVREVTLLGQNVNSYSWAGEEGVINFPGLLRMLAAHLREKRWPAGDVGATGTIGSTGARDAAGIGWIRFLTSHPKDLSAELVQVIAEEPIFCRHIHLCIQSGSDRVLALMNRKYTKEYFLGLVDTMRAAIPGLSLSTDILVGFPGETEEELEETLDVMRKVRFAFSFMYHFNPREGTPAVKLPDRVPDKVKKARLARVIALQKEISAELMLERLGAVDEVLIEDKSRRSPKEMLARTARDEMVVFVADPSRIGQFARVRLSAKSGNTFRAEEVHE
ncbi:MAG TPA: tRNA (N6-isopentenyl adenosine(37)-C2)-methylthiotransferase MiaB [Rectinemataceae bacterium]|nr:tRNA (N6-isopentenyl adenosine(37)-C2)-methylthiotransferase MiaB [Rectinemataceae bacterium]